MDDGQLLLRAILDDPSDRTARLVYADWLEENGQEDHAHFIRLSLADDECVKRKSLSRQFRTKWMKEVGRNRVNSACEGGFISELRMMVGEFQEEEVAGLFARHPITRVQLWGLHCRSIQVGTESRYCWADAGLQPPNHNRIPTFIFEMIPVPVFKWVGSVVGSPIFSRLKMFRRHADATKALSLACVNWGREQVGLGPLDLK